MMMMLLMMMMMMMMIQLEKKKGEDKRCSRSISPTACSAKPCQEDNASWTFLVRPSIRIPPSSSVIHVSCLPAHVACVAPAPAPNSTHTLDHRTFRHVRPPGPCRGAASSRNWRRKSTLSRLRVSFPLFQSRGAPRRSSSHREHVPGLPGINRCKHRAMIGQLTLQYTSVNASWHRSRAKHRV